MLIPAGAVCRVARERGCVSLVDSMSAFGGVPIDLAEWGADFLVSSSNKCIEGVPGFAFVLCRREALLATEGWARSLSFDLLAQWRGIEQNGQFRFTPPTHVILAFQQGLVSVVAALIAMAPVVPVLLAWAVLRERVRPIHAVAIGVVFVAVVLMVAG